MLTFPVRYLTDHIFSIALVTIILKTTFFYDKFGVTFNGLPSPSGANDAQLHTIVYLQVAIISQALIFVTRSHGFFFMERPSVALMVAFCLAQLISSIIAAYGDWGFTQLQGISGGWIGIVWVWVCIFMSFIIVCSLRPQNIVWFSPLDWIKFAMKATVIKKMRERHDRKVAEAALSGGIPITRTQSRAASIHESMYSNRVSFIRRAARKVGFGRKISMKPEELQRFSSIQAQRTGATLARNPSRTAA